MKKWQHSPGFIKLPETIHEIGYYEKLLEEWFGAPVILLASARSGIDLYLRIKGFKRYTHKIMVPPYLSRCVINALTQTVFPVETLNQADGVLLYHQYGFPQRWQPKKAMVVEDIAHSFFSSLVTGDRRWAGEAAVFSLPKFFKVAGYVGGLIIRNKKTEKLIREFLLKAPRPSEKTKNWIRQTVVISNNNPNSHQKIFLEAAYELLLKFYHPDSKNLAGFPENLKEIKNVAKLRQERIDLYFSYLDKKTFPTGFWSSAEKIIPYALPYFGGKEMDIIKKELTGLGIDCDIYHLDIARNMQHPNYKKCLLLPCHQNIPLDIFAKICRVVKNKNKSYV